jgi:hypothetical protein
MLSRNNVIASGMPSSAIPIGTIDSESNTAIRAPELADLSVPSWSNAEAVNSR